MSNEVIDQEFKTYLDALGRLVACASVRNEAEEAPFGHGINQALDTVLDIAREWGFETYRAKDGTYGYAEIGSGPKMMGILGHVDVVSVGDPSVWKHAPFALSVEDGTLFGRGVQDDKGPVLATLFALKLLLDAGNTLKHRVRFIYGTDEESGWRCMDRYKEEQALPDFGFTPDANFPLIQVEKSSVHYRILDEEKRGEWFEGGVSGNAVPNSARMKANDALLDALREAGRDFEVIDGIVNVKGVAAHASTPEQGKNAIVQLVKARVVCKQASPLELFINDLYTHPIFDRFYDEISGYLTYNVGIVRSDDEAQYATLDIRFPLSFEKFEVSRLVETYAHKYGLTVEAQGGLPGIQVSTKSELFKGLYEAYQEVTGDVKTEPLKIGGATYARAMPNIVAYGMLLPNAPMTMHQVDESISIADVKTAIGIYKRAFEKIVIE